MTSGFGWTLRIVTRFTVNSHPLELSSLLLKHGLYSRSFITLAHLHLGEDKMIKVYDSSAQINATVLMVPCKYSIQTDYLAAGQGLSVLWMSTMINGVVKVQSPYVLIFISFIAYFLLFVPSHSHFRDTLITNCWHIIWVIAKDVWVLKQPLKSAKSFIKVTWQMVAQCDSM